MTPKEIMTQGLNFQPTPRTPVTILTGVTWALRREKLSPEQMLRLPDAGARILVDAGELIGTDMIYGGRTMPYLIIRAMGGQIDNSLVGLNTNVIKSPLKTLADVDKLDIEEVSQKLEADEDYQLMLEQTKNMRKLVGDDKFIAVGGFAPFTMAGQMVNISLLMKALIKDKEAVHKLMAFATEIVYRFTAKFLEVGGDLVYIADPTSSGDLISPKTYEEFALPALKEIVRRCKQNCPYLLFHVCGHTKQRLEPLRESGISCFSVDSVVDMAEALKIADKKYALMGNLSPTAVLERKGPQEVYDMSMELCRTGGHNGGFVLGPGCDLAPDTPLENLQAMVKAAHDFHA